MPCYSPKIAYWSYHSDRPGKIEFKNPDMRAYGPIYEASLKRWRETGELVSVHPHYSPFLLPCGDCFGCRRTRAAQYGARSVHELSETRVPSCMLTLTYENAPFSLDHSHWQDFAKRLRWHFKQPLRILMCGEYGERTLRSHFHAIVFGEDFSHDRSVYKRTSSGTLYNSRSLDLCWGHGWSTVNDVSLASAMYVGGYCYKKINSAGNEPDRMYYSDGRRKEYVVSSHKPALGVPWIEHYAEQVFSRDECLVMKSGVTMPIPRAYKEWAKKYRTDLYNSWYARVCERIADGVFDAISHLEDENASEYAVQYNSIVLGVETDYIASKRKDAQYIAEHRFARKTQI